MIKYLIVDDEPLAHELIEEFCSMLPHMELQAHCFNAMEALQYLNQNKVDLMFLDLNMPKLKGFEFLRTLSNPPKVIVTTAYQEHALEGFELNVVDYLLKPFSFDRLVKAINKSMEGPQKTPKANDTISPSPTYPSFFVKGDKKYHRIAASKILFIEAYGNYSKIFLEEEMILAHEKISHLESMLPVGNFLRIHKSFIVHKDKISTIEGNRIKIEDHAIPIGQTYRNNVNSLLG